MKQKKTIADFREEWEAVAKKINVMAPNYVVEDAVEVDGHRWTVQSGMFIDAAARPNVRFAPPEGWRPASLDGPDGKPLPPTLPVAVTEMVARHKAGLDRWLRGEITTPGEVVAATPPRGPEPSGGASPTCA